MVRGVDWTNYRLFLEKSNRKEYVSARLNYAMKYFDCYSNPSRILAVPVGIRSNILKAMICLSKYLNEYDKYKTRLRESGVRWTKPDGISTFLNILSNHNDDIPKWYRETSAILGNNYKVFLRFVALTSLRKGEAINSFNLIQRLAKEGRLEEYYDAKLSMLKHYQFKSLFCRTTKNVYISIVPSEIIQQIIDSEPLSYGTIRKFLARRRIKLRLKDLRAYQNSYLRKHGILAECIDLLSGRLSPSKSSVFFQHYFRESPEALSNEILPLLKSLENSLS